MRIRGFMRRFLLPADAIRPTMRSPLYKILARTLPHDSLTRIGRVSEDVRHPTRSPVSREAKPVAEFRRISLPEETHARADRRLALAPARGRSIGLGVQRLGQQCIKVGWLSSRAAGRVEEIQGSDVLQRVYLGHA